MSRFWIERREVSRENFVVCASDPSFTMGLTVFETMRTYRGRLFRLRAHLDRLGASLERFGIVRPDLVEWIPFLEEVASASVQPSRLRWTFRVDGTAYLEAVPLDVTRVGRPLDVVTRSWEPPAWLDGRTKHGSRAYGEVLVRRLGVDEVIWLGRDGCFTEAARSNVFAVVDGRLLTPPDDGRILAGVTRAAVIEAAQEAGVEVIQTAVHPALAREELFLTSTLKEIAPVAVLDGAKLSGLGPVGEAVHEAFRALVAQECAA